MIEWILALPQFLRTQPGTELGSDSPSMNVTVIATNGRGTIAALRAAEKLAANLGASIALVKAQIIPFEFPLEDPPVSIDFLQRQLYGLVCEAGIEAQKITVRLWFCRDRFVGLRKILRPRSLVVIGGRKRWWSREKALERFLNQRVIRWFSLIPAPPTGMRHGQLPGPSQRFLY